MEVKKTIKRIVALGAGATMVGATLMSAMAASYTLDQYPTPFVKDGKLDALIVIGKNAMTEDVIGAVDIGASLQYAMRQTKSVSAGKQEVVIDKGVKVKGTGNEVLNYGEYMANVVSNPLDDADLPQLLADGRYKESKGNTKNDHTYTQRLDFTRANNGQALHDQPDDGLNANDYLEIKDTALLYNYTLQFDDPVEFDATSASTIDADFEGSSIEIQGQKFTFTESKDTNNDDLLDEVRLQAGDTLLWLTQDQVIEKTVGGVTHQIKVVDVTDNQDSCGISVDGDLTWVDVNNDETVNGVNVGVLDAKAVHAQLQDVDICQLNIGATEIRLKHNDNLEVDGKEVQDARVDLRLGSAAGKWNGFSVGFTPDDNVYLTKGQNFVDPALGLWKIVMEGVNTDRELISVTSSGSKDGALTFNNNEGKEVKVPLHFDTAFTGPDATAFVDELVWAKSTSKLVLVHTDDRVTASSMSGLKGTEFYLVTSGQTAHMVEISSVDTDNVTNGDGSFNFKDLTYGRTWETRPYKDAGFRASSNFTRSASNCATQLTNTSTNSFTVSLNQTAALCAIVAGDYITFNITPTATATSIFRVQSITTAGVATLDRATTNYIDGNTSVSELGTGGITTVDLGSLGTFDIMVTENGADLDGDGTAELTAASVVLLDGDNDATSAETNYGVQVRLASLNPYRPNRTSVDDDSPVMAVNLTEQDIDDSQVAGQNIYLLARYDQATDQQIEFQFSSLANGTAVNPTAAVTTWPRVGYDKVDSDSDVQYSSTAHGTLVEYDNDKTKWVKVWYPKEEVEVNAFVAPVNAVTSATGGQIETVQLEQINVGAARLDEEVTDVTKDNLIVVGGPCVNTVAAKLLGNPEPCTTGFKEGSAVVKLMANGDKVAMLVAGHSAADTRRATTVVSHWKQYPAFKGTEVEVTGTSLTDITVKSPQ